MRFRATLIFFQSLHLVIAHDVKQEVVLTGNNEIDKQVGKKELHHSHSMLLPHGNK